MSGKKGAKIRRMTEDDYNNYIMALKDEKPIPEYVSVGKKITNEHNLEK